MNQIPYEGEFCLDCPCKDVAWKSCALYEEKVSLDRHAPLRLPICISERPKIVKDGMERPEIRDIPPEALKGLGQEPCYICKDINGQHELFCSKGVGRSKP